MHDWALLAVHAASELGMGEALAEYNNAQAALSSGDVDAKKPVNDPAICGLLFAVQAPGRRNVKMGRPDAICHASLRCWLCRQR